LSQVTFCVLDLETTGTDPRWDDITEVGAILVRGGERLGTFHTLVGPGHAGIDGVLPSLLGFIGEAVITGHNISFDIRFLSAALARAERPGLDDGEVVDTMYLARALLRDDADDCRLATLAERFQFEHRPCHRAFEDAAATVDLLHLLIERSSAFGVVALDDLCALPTLAGHKWASKLRHTMRLAREPGVYTCRDEHHQVIWVGVADDLRREVRALFTKSGAAMHTSVLRDTHGWDVHHLATPIERDVARARLLHTHRPRLQRRQVTGESAAYLRVESTGRGVQVAAVRVPKPSGWHLGPSPSRTVAASAASGVRRLATTGADILAVLHAATDGDPGSVDSAFDALAVTAGNDAVELALLRRDQAALHELLRTHRRVEAARATTGMLHVGDHRVSVVQGLLDGEHLPPLPSSVPPPDAPLPADLLEEVLLVADALVVASTGVDS
jgi:DNA polymerase-3 subunit epsilon